MHHTTRLGCLLIGLTLAAGCLLRASDPPTPTLRVTKDLLTQAKISPYQYGQFIEYLCTLVPSMWAEKLSDGSFEGLSRYTHAYLRQTDFREKPWYPTGATNRAKYISDRSDPVSGKVAQKIAAGGTTPCVVGIAQDGIAVQRDVGCHFSCYLKQVGIHAPVRVTLVHEAKTYASATFDPTATWKKYTARLAPNGTDANVTLRITFQGPGTLWLDSASLMPEDAIGGWRPDVVEAVRALKPGIIRFGGSALDSPGYGEFDWRSTVGDPDRRPPWRAWGGLQPAGAGLEEIVQFCRLVNAEPLICVRIRDRQPRDAADEVQYFNGATDTPMGELRAHNGHAAPYHIKFWQIGNEQSGSDYEARMLEFCKAMKAVDPSIRLLSSFPSAGVLRRAGDLLDYTCPHQYDCGDLAGSEAELLQTQKLIRRFAPNRSIHIAVTEWNTTAGDWGPGRARLWTLENALACSRYHNLLHRHCDLVEIANRSNLTNSFCSGIIQTDNHRLYKTPTYYAQKLYATLAGDRPLRVEAPGNLDVSATLASKTGGVTLFVVNPGSQDITPTVDLSAFGRDNGKIDIWTLADRERKGQPDVSNSFAAPERVRSVHSMGKLKSGALSYRFPAFSLTVMVKK
jgi:alpha-L-arabinofuranosidase